jgi:hypothetical protein
MKRSFVLLASLVALAFFVDAARANSENAGVELHIRLADRLDTGSTQVGRQFSGSLEEPVRIDKRTSLPKGAVVKGTVTNVVSSGRLKRPASITLQLNGLGTSAVSTDPLVIDGNSHAARDTALIGGGAAAGAILGAIAGGGKGAAIGSVIGAGAGTGTAFATGKQEIVLPSETELVFTIGGPVPHGNSYVQRPAQDSGYQGDPRTSNPPQGEEEVSYNEPPPPSGTDVNIGITIGPPPPPHVVYARPAVPGPDLVWIEGYWYPVGHHYVWHDGYWMHPPHEGYIWIAPRHDGRQYFAGHWSQNPHYFQHHPHYDNHDRNVHEGHDSGHGHAYGRYRDH